MPDITIGNSPEWYGGQKGFIGTNAARAHQVTSEKYTPYKGNRIAPFSPLQEDSFNLARDELNNPAYPSIFKKSTNAITNALGQDISADIMPYIKQGTSSPVDNVGEYMNPYNNQVVENIGKYASRNLNENILPNVRDRFIQSGSYGSSGAPGSGSHQDITGRAIRDTQEAVTRAQSEALQSGYNKALDTSVGQQERSLQAGRLLGSTRAEDLNRSISGGSELLNASGKNQSDRRQNIGVLGQLGSLQQQQAQNALNTDYADFKEEQNQPYLQTARENELIRGLPATQYTASSGYIPPIPQASPWSQGAGLLTGAIGAANQRPAFSHGGKVTKKPSVAHLRHYADGGSVQMTPIQKGVNDAFDTTEIRSMREQAAKLAQPQVDPFWAAVAKGGFTMAANRKTGVLANLGEAASAGMDEYHGQNANQDRRNMASSNIMSMIDNTRRNQAERDRKHQQDLTEFNHRKVIDSRKMGMEEENHGMRRERFKMEKEQGNIFTGKDGMMYELTKDENGNRVAKMIEGIKPIEENGRKNGRNDLYKKSNEKAIEEVRSSFKSLPTLMNNLNALDTVAKRLNTGANVGSLAKTNSRMGWLMGVGAVEDLDQFEALTNQIVLDLGNQLKGNTVALGKLNLLAKTKPQLINSKEGNKKIIDHLKELAELAQEQNRFALDTMNDGGNAVDAEDLYNQYTNEKFKYEEANEGKTFGFNVRNFRDAGKKEEEPTKNVNDGKDISWGTTNFGTKSSSKPTVNSMSSEKLRKIAGQ
jgi:hypothetical protein